MNAANPLHQLPADISSQPWTAFFPVYLSDGTDLCEFAEYFYSSAFRYLALRCVYNPELQSAFGLRRGTVDLIISRSSPGFVHQDEGLTVRDLEAIAAADWSARTCLSGNACVQTSNLHRDILEGVRADHVLQLSLRFCDSCSSWLAFPVPYRLNNALAKRGRRRKKGCPRNLQWVLPAPDNEASLLVVGARVHFFPRFD